MNQNVMENVSLNIKRLREKQGLSQEDIAKQLNIARPVISNWERGTSEPSTSQLARLAQVLNVSLDVLVHNEAKGKTVTVIDTSMLLKRPKIIEELIEKFDEIIVPQIVINELNNLKDNGKPFLKRNAALIMNYINNIKDKNKNLFVKSFSGKSEILKNDEQIAKIALERAEKNFADKVYVFSNDIWFHFLVKEKRTNLFLLTFENYKNQFLVNNDSYDEKKSYDFMQLIKEKKWENIFNMEYDSEIDINYMDSATGFTPLIQAIRYKNIDVVKYLLEKYESIIDLDYHDTFKYYFTPLLHSAQIKNLEIMQLLVSKGADIDLGSRSENAGNTPLMVCAHDGFYEGAKFLVEQDACINQQDKRAGFTALIKACKNGHYDIAALLIDDTDIYIRSRENKKAIEYINPNKPNAAKFYELFKRKKK
jgi:transcriptional regulator with XRE-family HTH domain